VSAKAERNMKGISDFEDSDRRCHPLGVERIISPQEDRTEISTRKETVIHITGVLAQARLLEKGKRGEASTGHLSPMPHSH